MDLNISRGYLGINILIGIFTLNIFLSNIGIYGGRTSIPLAIAACLLLLISLMLLGKRAHGKVNAKAVLPIALLGLIFGIYGLVFMVPTYLMYAFIFVVQIPLFVFAIDEPTLKYIIKSFAKSFFVCYVFVMALAHILSPLAGGQYFGIFNNPNQWGEMQTVALLVELYLLGLQLEKNKVVLIKTFIGITLANVYFSQSRTTLLAVIAILFVYFIFSKRNKVYNLKSLISFVVMIAIGICSSLVILAHITPAIFQHTFDFSEKMNLPFVQLYETEEMESDEEIVGNRYLKGINDGGSFTSGRKEIWAKYISETEFWGHEPDDLLIDDYAKDGFKTNAHNTFLQVGYYGGIPALAIYFIYVISVGLFWLKKFIKEAFTPEEFFAIAAMAQASVYMMLSNAFGPYQSFAVISFWMITCPLYFYKKNQK